MISTPDREQAIMLIDEAHEWLTRYNETWPHDSLGDASPIEYTRNAGFSTFELST